MWPITKLTRALIADRVIRAQNRILVMGLGWVCFGWFIMNSEDNEDEFMISMIKVIIWSGEMQLHLFNCYGNLVVPNYLNVYFCN